MGNNVELNSPLDDPAVALVRRLLPSAVVETDAKRESDTHTPSYHIHLPLPVGAEYRFTLWLGCLGYGEKVIRARLTTDEAAHFWYMPFEEAAFRSAEQLNEAFLDTVELIIRHNTRIEQKRGLIFNHFKCEYGSASGWKRIYGLSALRWMRAPKMLGKRQVYQSPSLVPHI
jgi:hypothetical protein